MESLERKGGIGRRDIEDTEQESIESKVPYKELDSKGKERERREDRGLERIKHGRKSRREIEDRE